MPKKVVFGSLPRMRFRFPMVLVVLALVLGFFEALARMALPEVQDCSKSWRNQFRFRAWPEYMSGLSSATGTVNLVLLTNSQGYAGEHPANKAYPARLEGFLNERAVGGFRNWKVMNWSADGMTSIEYIIMASALRKSPPFLVLAVTGFADYRTAHARAGFSYCRSDLPRLATRWSVFKELPRSYLRRHIKVEDTATCWVADRLALPRFREYMWSWLDNRFPGVQNVMFSPTVNYHPWELEGRAVSRPLQLKKVQDEALDLSYLPDGPVMLAEYLQRLARIPATTVVVSEPRRESNKVRMLNDSLFQEDIKSLTGEYGMVLWDLHDALPAEDFLDWTHFKMANHERFAGMLAERISALVDRRLALNKDGLEP